MSAFNMSWNFRVRSYINVISGVIITRNQITLPSTKTKRVVTLSGGSRGSVQGVNTSPIEMKPSSSYSFLKFVYLISQLRCSLILDPPL